tara:strand:- start:34 stop:756 length:723 start_codon:yes stop_codon:yes gene_type:complete
MSTEAIVYGNGESRKGHYFFNEFPSSIVTWGCNAMYRDINLDNLVSVDYGMQQEIYESGYAHLHKCWFGDWNIIPSYFYGDKNILIDKLMKENKTGIVHQNSKGPHRDNCVINGGGIDGGLYITWVDDEDMVTPIDFPREWCSGTTAIHLACQEGYDKIYLMGFDLEPKKSYINNIYKGTKNYDAPLKKESKWKVDVQKEKMKVIFNEFKNIKFIWVEPKHDTEKFSFKNLTYETYKNIY